MGKVRIIVLAGAAALALAGCMRQSALYEITHAGTVDATISIGMHEDYIDETAPHNGITAVDDILDHFVTETIVDNDYGEWVGYRITLHDEPMSSFADPATESWDLQILGDDSDWVVYGMEYDPDQDGVRQAILDNDGYLDLAITFPGDLVEENGAVMTMYPDPGVAQWNMGTITEQPYARGRMPFVGPPEPPDPPAPDPVVTVVIPPDPPAPNPVITPDTAPSASASPTAAAAPAALPESESEDIPLWVWGVGAGLLAAIVGLGTYMLVSRSKGAAAKPDDDEPEAD